MRQNNKCGVMEKKPAPRPDLNHRPPEYWPGTTLGAWRGQLRGEFYCYIDRLKSNGHHSYQVSAEFTGQRGQPHFVIHREQLLYLISLGFSWTGIVSLLGVSHMTAYRRREEYNLLDDPSNTLNDDELKDLLREI